MNPPRHAPDRLPAGPTARATALALLGAALLGGCAATTTFAVTPSPQATACRPDAQAVPVFWAPRWRADQKDVPDRETAAAKGLARFFQRPGCYGSVSLQRAADAEAAVRQAAAAVATGPADRTLSVTVRELGPVLRLGGSAALVEGGTEVVLDIAVFDRGDTVATARRYSGHWRHGGPGVVKGVATLPEDMAAALAASLQAPAP